MPRLLIELKSGTIEQLNQIDRRLLRLKNFFSPYPQFQLEIRSDLTAPVHVLEHPKEPRFKYLVQIYPGLLADDQPEWIEAAILNYALTLAAERKRAASRNSATSTAGPSMQPQNYFRRLVEIYRKITGSSDLVVRAAMPEAAELPRRARGSSDLELKELWLSLRGEYFPGQPELDDYTVTWSYRRHTSTLASCQIETSRVRVAAVMKQPEGLLYLEPLVYHEMCHAALGRPLRIRGRRVIHGREFKALERRHPRISQLDSWIELGGWHRLVRNHPSGRP